MGVSPQGLEGDAVKFTKDFPATPIGLELELLHDPSAALTLKEVQHSTAFVKSRSEVPNLGLSKSAHWARFTVFNADPAAEMMLLVDFPEIEELDVYLEQQSGIIPIFSGGQSRPTNFGVQRSPNFQFDLPVPFGGVGTVYLRMKGGKQLQLPVFVTTRAATIKSDMDRNIFIGGYIGIMVVMILYNLFIYLSIREKSYAIYVVYIAFVMITQLSFAGWVGYYIIPEWTWGKEHASLAFTVFTAILSIAFMRSFIQVRERSRPIVNAIAGLMLVCVLLDMLGMRILAYGIVQALSFFLAIYLLSLSVIYTRRRIRSALFFLISWSVFLTGIMIFVAKDWGLVPYNDLTKYMMSIGSSIEVVLLSFGLADRINVLRKEKDRSQAEALRTAQEKATLIREQNTVLELKVAERTHALQESNDHLKQTQSQLVSAEKMASLGQLTAGIAHEINNPINYISSSIPPLKRDLGELREVLEAYREASKGQSAMAPVHALEQRIGVEETVREVEEILAALENGASRTSEIVRGLRTFSRLDEDDLKEADINEALRSTVVVLGPQFRDAVSVVYDLQELPRVECYPGKLNQLFMNLLNNAAHAVKMRHGKVGGSVHIATKLLEEHVQVVIQDNGVGMDQAVQARLFEPFFTTKDVGEGTGLGLSIAKGIIDKHHGQVTVESEPGIGTIFTVTLPTAQTRQFAKSA